MEGKEGKGSDGKKNEKGVTGKKKRLQIKISSSTAALVTVTFNPPERPTVAFKCQSAEPESYNLQLSSAAAERSDGELQDVAGSFLTWDT